MARFGFSRPDYRTQDAIIEGACVGEGADPGEMRLGQIALRLRAADFGMARPDAAGKVWQIGRPCCHFEGAARQIIFKITAMRRGDFPPMCDNARQGARIRRIG
jgi:hypothetical protein